MEKFVLITFVICLLGTIQCTLADESANVEGQLDENGRFFEKAKNMYAEAKTSVQNKVNDNLQKVTSAAKNSYLVGRAVNRTNDAINNMVIPLPYSVKNTEYGEYMNNLSRQLTENAKTLQNYMMAMNDTVGDVSNATLNLLKQLIDNLRLKRDGPCFEAVRVLQQNFTVNVLNNFKACVSQASNSILLFTASINEMQAELNTALQDGKFRVGLMNEIAQTLSSLPGKVKEIGSAIPECEMTQIGKNLLSALTVVGSECYYSFFEKS